MDNERRLTPLQKNILEMFKWFDCVCRKHSLRYYMVGGTMLGAVRHQGFIPWDDDIDVCMPREDYEKLTEIVADEKNDRYILETPVNGAADFCYPYYKLYDKTTTLIENYRLPLKRGTFLDIFPLDGIADSKEEAAKVYVKRRRKYNLYIARMAAIRPERAFYKNAYVLAVRLIPKVFLNNTKLRMQLDQSVAGKTFDNSRYVTMFFGNWGLKEVMPSAIFGKPVKYQFEDMKAYGVADYEGYLTRVYGQWRQLPPAEKQVTHHDFLQLDLSKGYLCD